MFIYIRQGFTDTLIRVFSNVKKINVQAKPAAQLVIGHSQQKFPARCSYLLPHRMSTAYFNILT